MKDFNDFLLGDGWDEDLATGLILPPGTVKDDLYEVQGGPQHVSNPGPFYFVTRPGQPEPYDDSSRRRRLNGIAVFSDGSILRTEDGRVRQLHGLEAIKARAELRRTFGEAIADAAGIEPE